MHHMDLVDWAQVIGGAAAVAAFIFAAWQIWLTIGNERRRIQPIVIGHETQSRRFTQGGSDWSFKAYLQNSGQGPAFNVRFGVEIESIRWPYRMRDEDPGSGNRQRVVQASSRLPEKGDFEIKVSGLELLGAVEKRLSKEWPKASLDAGRVYWCRYENAVGQTWETRNPGDRSADLDIRRVRIVGWDENREVKAREKANDAGQQLDDQLYEEMFGRRRGSKPGSSGHIAQAQGLEWEVVERRL